MMINKTSLYRNFPLTFADGLNSHIEKRQQLCKGNGNIYEDRGVENVRGRNLQGRRQRVSTRCRQHRTSSGNRLQRPDHRQTSPCITPPFNDVTAKYPKDNSASDNRGDTPTEDFGYLKIAPHSDSNQDLLNAGSDKLMATGELFSLPVLQKTASRTTVSLENVEMWESDSEEAESSGRFDNINGVLINPRKTFDFSELRRDNRPIVPQRFAANHNDKDNKTTTADNTAADQVGVVGISREVSQAWPPSDQQHKPTNQQAPAKVSNHNTERPSRQLPKPNYKKLNSKHERMKPKEFDKNTLNKRSSSLSRVSSGKILDKTSPERSPTRITATVSSNQLHASSHSLLKSSPPKPPRRFLPQQPTQATSTKHLHQQISKYSAQISTGSDSSSSSSSSSSGSSAKHLYQQQFNKTYVIKKPKSLLREERTVDSLETLPKRTKSSDSESNSNGDSNTSSGLGLIPMTCKPSSLQNPANIPKNLEKKRVKFHGIVQMKEGDTNSYDFLRMSGDTAKFYKKKYLPSVYSEDA